MDNIWVNVLHRYLDNRFDDTTAALIAIAVTLGLALTCYLLVRLIVRLTVHKIIGRTATEFDDALVKRHLFARLSHIAPAAVIFASAPFYTSKFFGFDLVVLIEKLALAYFVVVGVRVFFAVLDVIGDVYDAVRKSPGGAIKSFVQCGKIISFLIGAVFLVSVVTDQDPWGVVAGVGALTAVLLLVFKDTILGLMASIQIFLNDLIDIGDWIEMPKYGADGDVVEISLTTIKVRNFDNTITTIPAYAFVADSFKNWRGMKQSGGRRIKRSLHIDMNSVTFCSDEMLSRFKGVSLISKYVESKLNEIGSAIGEDASTVSDDTSINQRQLTNLGTFREYVKAYVSNHQQVHKGMTLIVRQLAPTPHGIPLEIYCFSDDTNWASYEDMQADIFDHLLAVLPEFGLRIFQEPTGLDFRSSYSRRG